MVALHKWCLKYMLSYGGAAQVVLVSRPMDSVNGRVVHGDRGGASVQGGGVGGFGGMFGEAHAGLTGAADAVSGEANIGALWHGALVQPPPVAAPRAALLQSTPAHPHRRPSPAL